MPFGDEPMFLIEGWGLHITLRVWSIQALPRCVARCFDSSIFEVGQGEVPCQQQRFKTWGVGICPFAHPRRIWVSLSAGSYAFQRLVLSRLASFGLWGLVASI